ncbi:MAG: DUF2258 domain-containing protein [Desulfurococcaceae archaeon TW002]
MPTMRTGLVIAGGYATKIRRVVFAQLAEDIKEKRIDSKMVAFHVAQLNRFLFTVLVDRLKVDKRDAVRISIDYEVSGDKIIWKFDTLRVEVFRRVSDEEVSSVLSVLVPEAERIMAAPVEYTVEFVGETSDGDKIYALKVAGGEGGILELIPVNEEFLYVKVGVLLVPEPTKVEKVKIALEGRSYEEALKASINDLLNRGKPVTPNEADSIISYVRSRLGEVRPEVRIEYE